MPDNDICHIQMDWVQTLPLPFMTVLTSGFFVLPWFMSLTMSMGGKHGVLYWSKESEYNL